MSKWATKRYQKQFDESIFKKKGIFCSDKAGNVSYRNSYELQLFRLLDANPGVKSFRSRSVSYEYYHPEKDEIVRGTVEADVDLSNGSRKLISVRPIIIMEHETTIAQIEAIELKALEMKIPFEIWTEIQLFGSNPAYMKALLRFVLGNKS